MHCEIRYQPAFAAMFVTLEPGESIVAEAGAMISMDGNLSINTRFSGGLFSGLIKKYFGGESLFVNQFTNQTNQPLNLVLSQGIIGDIQEVDLDDGSICLQPGAYIASTPNVKMGVRWAGFASWFAGEGLLKLKIRGKGKAWFGAYGGISTKRIDGEFIVDNNHLVAYELGIRMKIGLSGGLVSSFTSGEGLVNRLNGQGIIYLQSRSIDGLVKYLRPKIR